MLLEAAGRWLEDALLVGLFAALTGLSVLQIVLRNVWSSGLLWGDGLVRISVLWIALIGAVAASRDQKHIAIDLAHRLLPASWRRAITIVVDAFTAAVCGLLSYHAWVFVGESRAYADTLLGDWPAWIFQIVLPVGFALIAYRYALRCLRRIVGVTR
jgi:TRAP-type C4-dicarboxylate transport system permease small subunit